MKRSLLLLYKIKVLNLLGQVVYLSEKTNQLPMFDRGVYTVIIFSDAGNALKTIQLVVE